MAKKKEKNAMPMTNSKLPLVLIFIFSLFIQTMCISSPRGAEALFCNQSNNENEHIEIEKKGFLLKGLRFTSNQDDIDFKPFEGIKISNLNILHENTFRKMMSKFIGKKISVNLYKQIKNEATSFYVNRGYSTVFVSIPTKQPSHKNIVQVVILLGKLGDVKVEGNNYFSSSFLKRQITTKKGEYINCDNMMNDLSFINKNPFRSVNILYQQGKDVGETDITLEVHDRCPVRSYAGYTNTGNKVEGSSRWNCGFNIGNVFNLDHQLNYQLTSALDPKKWNGHTASYIIPLPWRHQFTLFGNYTISSYKKLDSAKHESENGRNWQISGRYNIPIDTCDARGSIVIGYDFKRTNNFDIFYGEGAAAVSNAKRRNNKFTDISQFLIGVEGAKDDRLGTTSYGFHIYFSPGNMTPYNNKRSMNLERDTDKNSSDKKSSIREVNCSYIIAKANIDRVLKLPKDFSWVLTTQGQVSSEKLLASEEFMLGGAFTIRGYKENEILGDTGLFIKNELRTNAFPLFKKTLKNDSLQLLAFFDWGLLADCDKNIVWVNKAWLASVGPGLRYSIGDRITLRFDYGFQLRGVKIKKVEIDKDGNETLLNEFLKKGSRLHMEVSLSF